MPRPNTRAAAYAALVGPAATIGLPLTTTVASMPYIRVGVTRHSSPADGMTDPVISVSVFALDILTAEDLANDVLALALQVRDLNLAEPGASIAGVWEEQSPIAFTDGLPDQSGRDVFRCDFDLGLVLAHGE